MSRRLLVTGASGFIGHHVVSAALRKAEFPIRLIHHRRPPNLTAPAQVDIVHADLTRSDSLSGVCRDVDAVVHCASLIRGDAEALDRANARGTEALVADARRHGVRRIVYVSTAAVYGRGPHRRSDVSALALRPASATSRSRAAAEAHVLAAGGTVLRPHLVYGTGDRWVVPGLVALLRHLQAPVLCSSMHSAVDARTLADVAVEAALSEQDTAGAHHVNHPVPLSGSALVSLAQELLHMRGARSLTYDEARERATGSPVAQHHLDMLSSDHWFLSDSIWDLLSLDPGQEPSRNLPQFLPWYRKLTDQDGDLSSSTGSSR
ncbi:NAD(P)-dependent oxidoreductase [Streptomyces sp. NPDC050095]|uniref:NAD-dependent epimerase/dehydratase family protein n=1 Tax=unclassified Streptomyces TaxID=2593676 RepID=UPI0034337EC6